MFADQRGLPVTAASEKAAAAFDSTIDAYLELRPDTGPLLKSTFKSDPDMPLAHYLKGYFFKLMASGPLEARAADAHAKALDRTATATAREQSHAAALGRWCDQDLAGASAIWEEILAEHPHDVLALRLSHHGHFYMGDSAGMHRSVTAALAAWSPETPGYSYVLGMKAFACEECGDYRAAEAAGREAIERNPMDPWSVHAVAHVMEMEDRRHEGIEWLSGLEAHWTQANNFRYHLWWHRALMHLELGQTDEVLRLYDEDLWDPESDEYLDLCNDSSLLLRLEFLGVDVGERWMPLAEKVAGRNEEHLLTFIDAHFAIILAAAGEWSAADHLIETMRANGGPIPETVGVPLCSAILSHRRGNSGSALAALNQVRDKIIAIGGSHAQRDLFELLLIDCALNGDDLDAAKALLEERTAAKPGNATGWRHYGDLLEKLGDMDGAAAAAERVAGLRTN